MTLCKIFEGVISALHSLPIGRRHDDNMKLIQDPLSLKRPKQSIETYQGQCMEIKECFFLAKLLKYVEQLYMKEMKTI